MLHKVLIIVLTSILPAQAAEWKASFNGDIGLEALQPFEDVSPDTVKFRKIGNLKTPTTIRYGKTFRLRLLPLIQWDPNNISKSERFYWDAQEGYLQIQSLPWTLQLGYNVVQWGDTDVFNPLDVVNPRRYFDPFRSEKISSPMILAKRDFENFMVEALWIPTQRKTLLPGEKSRWLPRDFYRDKNLVSVYGTARVKLPTNMNYHFVEPVDMDNAFENNFGARMKFRFSGFDWTLAGFEGTSSSPTVAIRALSGTTTQADSVTREITLVVDPDIYLRAAFYKIRMYGTSFVWVLGDFLVKGASAYTKPISALGIYPSSYLPPRILENALGLEKTINIGELSLTMLLQGTYVSRSDSVDNTSVSLSRMFDKAAMGGLRFVPGEKFSVLLSYLRDIKFKGNFFHGEGDYKFKDGWKLKLSGDILGGATETPLGTYRRNDRVNLALNYQW